MELLVEYALLLGAFATAPCGEGESCIFLIRGGEILFIEVLLEERGLLLGAFVAAPCGELNVGLLGITGGGGCIFPDEELLVEGVDDIPNGDRLGYFLNRGISNKYLTGMNFVICSLYVKSIFQLGVSISNLLSPHI